MVGGWGLGGWKARWGSGGGVGGGSCCRCNVSLARTFCPFSKNTFLLRLTGNVQRVVVTWGRWGGGRVRGNANRRLI